MVGLGFYYSVFSTYNYDTCQFGYQHELVSLVALRNLPACRSARLNDIVGQAYGTQAGQRRSLAPVR